RHLKTEPPRPRRGTQWRRPGGRAPPRLAAVDPDRGGGGGGRRAVAATGGQRGGEGGRDGRARAAGGRRAGGDRTLPRGDRPAEGRLAAVITVKQRSNSTHRPSATLAVSR